MDILDILDPFHINRDITNGAIDTINNQFKLLTSQVTNPLKGLAKEVTGGIWKGDGADRFVAEMNTKVIPALDKLEGAHSDLNQVLHYALDLIEGAEDGALRIAATCITVVNDIENGVESIWNGISNVASSTWNDITSGVSAVASFFGF